MSVVYPVTAPQPSTLTLFPSRLPQALPCLTARATTPLVRRHLVCCLCCGTPCVTRPLPHYQRTVSRILRRCRRHRNALETSYGLPLAFAYRPPSTPPHAPLTNTVGNVTVACRLGHGCKTPTYAVTWCLLTAHGAGWWAHHPPPIDADTLLATVCYAVPRQRRFIDILPYYPCRHGNHAHFHHRNVHYCLLPRAPAL